MQNIIKIIIFLIFFFIISVFYISLTRETNYDTSNLINKKITEFKVINADETGFYTRDDLKKNDFTLINFWASWCAPCKVEHPILMRLSKSKKLKILGVNFKDKDKQAKKFLSDLGNPYDFLAKDINGKQSVSLGIYGIPESILINNELLIMQKFVGPLSLDDYNKIEELIK
ncbi:DsbE family thiol:disulfide interchange protein [Candidatus Pelagibacter bacterium]|jgi:cytochrome c biogenesis protein CcmG/thiol:disulfide interchange protein DsbE|nr:DsbE family thiol:disulfide interchange protein [Candidatus Pelagibacter bacterium]